MLVVVQSLSKKRPLPARNDMYTSSVKTQGALVVVQVFRWMRGLAERGIPAVHRERIRH